MNLGDASHGRKRNSFPEATPVPEATIPETPPAAAAVKEIFSRYRPTGGPLFDVIRVGHFALQEGDTRLATSAADFVIARVESKSADLFHALILKAFAEGRLGHIRSHDALMNRVIEGAF